MSVVRIVCDNTHPHTPANQCNRDIHTSVWVCVRVNETVCVSHTHTKWTGKIKCAHERNIRKIRFLYFKSIDIFYKWSQFLLTTTRSSGLCMSRETNDMTNQTKPKQKLQPFRFFFVLVQQTQEQCYRHRIFKCFSMLLLLFALNLREKNEKNRDAMAEEKKYLNCCAWVH